MEKIYKKASRTHNENDGKSKKNTKNSRKMLIEQYCDFGREREREREREQIVQYALLSIL